MRMHINRSLSRSKKIVQIFGRSSKDRFRERSLSPWRSRAEADKGILFSLEHVGCRSRGRTSRVARRASRRLNRFISIHALESAAPEKSRAGRVSFLVRLLLGHLSWMKRGCFAAAGFNLISRRTSSAAIPALGEEDEGLIFRGKSNQKRKTLRWKAASIRKAIDDVVFNAYSS